MIRHTTTAGMS